MIKGNYLITFINASLIDTYGCSEHICSIIQFQCVVPNNPKGCQHFSCNYLSGFLQVQWLLLLVQNASGRLITKLTHSYQKYELIISLFFNQFQILAFTFKVIYSLGYHIGGGGYPSMFISTIH